MTAAHVFMGAGYYPLAGVGDYKKSFYGDMAVDDAVAYGELEFEESRHDDWWVVLVDRGEGLREHTYKWR